MFLWYIGLSVFGVATIFRSAGIDYRLIAAGSLLPLVVDLGYVPQATAAPLPADIDDIAGMLYALRTGPEREER